MLSPSMITKSNGKPWRVASIRWATSYCIESPVPISPMAEKRTELDLRGNLNWSAGRLGVRRLRKIRKRKTRRRMGLPRRFEVLSDNLGNQIDNEIGFDIQKEQIAIHDPVDDFIGQFGKLEQQSRRDGGERNSLWINLIHAQMDFLERLPLADRGAGVPAVRTLKRIANRVAKRLLGFICKDVPGLGIGPRLANFSCQRLLVGGNHFRQVGGLQRGKGRFHRLVQLHISLHTVQELFVAGGVLGWCFIRSAALTLARGRPSSDEEGRQQQRLHRICASPFRSHRTFLAPRRSPKSWMHF